MAILKKQEAMTMAKMSGPIKVFSASREKRKIISATAWG